MHLDKMDVKTNFLHGDLEKQIYMKKLEGFNQNASRLVCKMKRSLYGLKHTLR